MNCSRLCGSRFAIFSAKWKTAANMKAVTNIWKEYGKGNISLDEARKQVVEKAGGFKTPEWFNQLKAKKAGKL